jgi:hypothetical protein
VKNDYSSCRKTPVPTLEILRRKKNGYIAFVVRSFHRSCVAGVGPAARQGHLGFLADSNRETQSMQCQDEASIVEHQLDRTPDNLAFRKRI